jgi:hypothetical protein
MGEISEKEGGIGRFSERRGLSKSDEGKVGRFTPVSVRNALQSSCVDGILHKPKLSIRK